MTELDTRLTQVCLQGSPGEKYSVWLPGDDITVEMTRERLQDALTASKEAQWLIGQARRIVAAADEEGA